MKRWIAGLLGSALMLAASGAQAGQVWNTLEFKVQPGQAGAVAKAVGDFQKTEVAQDRTATVTFYRILFNGVSPATHSITVLWPSRMENETSSAKMNASSEFQGTMASIYSAAEEVYNSSNQTLKGWGTVTNKDTLWTSILLNVTDPGKLLEAMDALMASEDFKEFPGQVWLSEIAFGNAVEGGVATHIITVGYQSQAEMEAWGDKSAKSVAWMQFYRASESVSTTINRTLVQEVQSWPHNHTLEDFKQ